jgi:hypothetical protein
MAKATEKPKVENVTIATVRSRQEARWIVARLGSTGIESRIVDERDMAESRSGKFRFGGIKVQVDRSDARRAVQLLRGSKNDDKADLPPGDSARRASWVQLGMNGWKRAAIGMIGIMAVAGLLAVWLF